MSEWVSKELIQAARRADLYDFLQVRHPGDVKREGNSIRLRCNHSISIKRGYSGFKDFATGATGNALDCLTKYLGYTLPDAAAALAAFMGYSDQGNEQAARSAQAQIPPPEPTPPANGPFELPPPVDGRYNRLFAYLMKTRELPPELIQQLIKDKLVYQEADHANIVFVNPERTFAELRGTNSAAPFHRVMFDPATPTAFWWYKANGLFSYPDISFVCEGAIDALSLYCLHQRGILPAPSNGLYCSIGGVTNQQRIDAIKAGMAAAHCPTVIAVDNDDAGELCRQRNPDCAAIIPTLKDWNEDLISALKEIRERAGDEYREHTKANEEEYQQKKAANRDVNRRARTAQESIMRQMLERAANKSDADETDEA